MEFSPAGIAQLSASLALAQAEITSAAKDRKNDHFKSKYADLASVWEACRTAITKHGLAVVQTIATRDNREVMVSTALLHKSGEWIKDVLSVPAIQPTPQAIGSAITYARRYALAAMVGVAPDDDDDGNAASNRPAARVEATPPPAPPRAGTSGDDMKARYTALRAQLVTLFGELRTRVLMKEFTEAHGEDREAILGKMREAVAEEHRANPMATGGK